MWCSVSKGSQGSQVTKIRTRLRDLKLYARPLDASFSGWTESGVTAFHKRRVRLPHCLRGWAGGGHDRQSMHVKPLKLPGTGRDAGLMVHGGHDSEAKLWLSTVAVVGHTHRPGESTAAMIDGSFWLNPLPNGGALTCKTNQPACR